MGMVWQAGGKMFDYNNGIWYINFQNPTALKVFQFWEKLFKDKSVKAEPWWNADWYKGLADGSAATVVCGGWFPEWLQLNCKTPNGTWRVAVPPMWDAKNPTNGEMGGSGFYVSSQCKNPEAAALFVLWLNSAKESLVQLHEKSQLPILWSNIFTRQLAPELANVEYPYFGGQKITPVSVQAMSLVNTAFTALPVMNYVSSSHNEEIAKFISGAEDAATFLRNWEAVVVGLHEGTRIQQPRGGETAVRKRSRSAREGLHRNHRAASGVARPGAAPFLPAGTDVGARPIRRARGMPQRHSSGSAERRT